MFILVILFPISFRVGQGGFYVYDSYNGNNESYELKSLLYSKDHSHDMEIKYI